MKIKAYSKVTLALKVYKKMKSESKHQINAVFALYRKIYDEIDIRFANSNNDNISYFCKNKDIKINDCNVCAILKFLRQHYQIPFYDIRIKKNIPIGAGLGGSAADAGTIAKYILAQKKIILDKSKVEKIALKVGSDIPFYLFNYDMAQVSRYGDSIKPYINKSLRFDVILTNIAMSSKYVYDKLDSDEQYKSLVELSKVDNALKSSKLLNDLQPYAFKQNKQLEKKYKAQSTILDKLILSGSGGSFVRLYFNK